MSPFQANAPRNRQGTGAARVIDLSPPLLLLPPAALTGFLWMNSPHASEPLAVFCSLLLLLMAWGGFLCWHRGDRRGLPVFALVTAAYWMYFGLALLTGTRAVPIIGRAQFAIPSEEHIAQAMLLATVGVALMWAGMRLPAGGERWRLPLLRESAGSWQYVRVLLVATLALKVVPGSMMLLGGGGRQLMVTLTAIVPTAAFVLLLLRHFRRQSTRADQYVLAAAVMVFVGEGLASGWLSSVVRIAIVYGAVVLMTRRNIPWVPVALVIAAFLFLQAGKNDFRVAYWGTPHGAGLADRAVAWVSMSASRWGDAIAGAEDENTDVLLTASMGRLSLLPQVARVLELTPSQVPFQHGDSYKYLAVTFIPRALWPDKPTISEANMSYQLLYGLSSERSVEKVSIAAGSLAEGYMNFGSAGALAAMLLIGLILGIYSRVIATTGSDLALAIGLALLPELLVIESQLGQYFAGVVQQALLTAAVLLPVAQRVSRHSQVQRRRSPHHLDAVRSA